MIRGAGAGAPVGASDEFNAVFLAYRGGDEGAYDSAPATAGKGAVKSGAALGFNYLRKLGRNGRVV